MIFATHPSGKFVFWRGFFVARKVGSREVNSGGRFYAHARAFIGIRVFNKFSTMLKVLKSFRQVFDNVESVDKFSTSFYTVFNRGVESRFNV
jgi:ASC-1-like (ASCH) protein